MWNRPAKPSMGALAATWWTQVALRWSRAGRGAAQAGDGGAASQACLFVGCASSLVALDRAIQACLAQNRDGHVKGLGPDHSALSRSCARSSDSAKS